MGRFAYQNSGVASSAMIHVEPFKYHTKQYMDCICCCTDINSV